jgi:F420-non-reducing hydrogenase small subunit
MGKLKFAFYWAGSCGGCEVAVLDINEKVLKVVELADIVFWPVAIDIKYSDVEAMEDKSIDVTFFNGAIVNSEHEHIAKLLRQKSKAMVAFGACSCFGGIPGLGNFTNLKEKVDRVYFTQSTENTEKAVPLERVKVKEGELDMPKVFDTVRALRQVVDVDYFLPGCAPPPDLIVTAVEAIATGNLPAPGSVLAGNKTVCDECEREKGKKLITEFKRFHEVRADQDKCLLEQGIVCCGPATRSGCNAACLSSNVPCRGCFGPPAKIHDQGAKLLSAISSIMDCSEPDKVNAMVDSLVDPAGYFYRFTLPTSMLKRRNMEVRA